MSRDSKSERREDDDDANLPLVSSTKNVSSCLPLNVHPASNRQSPGRATNVTPSSSARNAIILCWRIVSVPERSFECLTVILLANFFSFQRLVKVRQEDVHIYSKKKRKRGKRERERSGRAVLEREARITVKTGTERGERMLFNARISSWDFL